MHRPPLPPLQNHPPRFVRVVVTIVLWMSHWVSIPVAEALETFDELFQPDAAFPYFENVSAWPHDNDPAAWSSARAAMLAQLSMLVYVPDAAQVRATAMKGGFHTARFIEDGNSQVWVFESDTIRAIVFRGTEPGNTQDLLTDLRILPSHYQDGVRAHSGFVTALGFVAPQLDEVLAIPDPRPLWLSGHSMGGALAQLYAWRARELPVAGVVVFGAPRVFLAADHHRVSSAFHCYRVVNNNDAVPHLPTPPLYAHVGREWFIDESGRLQNEPTFGEKLSAAWQGHRDYAARWLSHWQETNDLRVLPGDALADHAPAAYARALIDVSRFMLFSDAQADPPD